jgi:hypothetical protein
MTRNGFREDQVTRVRGFADQRLRKPDAPLDSLNRRISLIVQYQEKPVGAFDAKGVGASGEQGEQDRPKEGSTVVGEPTAPKTE